MPEVPQRVAPLLALTRDHAQVKQGKGIARPFAQFAQQNPRVAIELPVSHRPVNIPGMPNGDIGPFHRHAGPAQRGQNLFVDFVRPAHALKKRKQPDMVNNRIATAYPRPGIARASDDVGRGLAPVKDAGACPRSCAREAGACPLLRVNPQAAEQHLQFFPLARFDQIIRIKPESIIPCGVCDAAFRAAAKSSIQAK